MTANRKPDLPEFIVTKPQGLSPRLFFQVFSGANAIAFAQLSSRTRNRFSRTLAPVTKPAEEVPGISYCLRTIEVSQNYRKQGIGTALLEEIIRFCQDEQVSALYGEARGDSALLRRWYTEKGFELDGSDNIHLSFTLNASKNS